jgi:hypothetical protein
MVVELHLVLCPSPDGRSQLPPGPFVFVLVRSVGETELGENPSRIGH